MTAQRVDPVAGKTSPESNEKAKKPPEVAEITFNQGKHAFAARDYTRAAYLFREAVNSNPDRKEYRLQLIQTLMKNQRWHKEAEEHLNDLIKAEPYNIGYHIMLGQVYKEGGMQKRAISKFKEVLSMEPQNRIARRELREMGELPAKGSKPAQEGINPSSLLARFKGAPPMIQYAIIGAVILLIIVILYYQL
jgi:predicted Zn-dependent protease